MKNISIYVYFCFLSATRAIFCQFATSSGCPLSTPVHSLSYLQHQLCHLELFLQALVGGHWLVVEQAQQVVSLQSLLVVALVDVQHPVLPVKIGELETFLSTAKENQVKAQAQE